MNIQTMKMINRSEITLDEESNNYYIYYDDEGEDLFLNNENSFTNEGVNAMLFSEEYYAMIYLNLLKQNL